MSDGYGVETGTLARFRERVGLGSRLIDVCTSKTLLAAVNRRVGTKTIELTELMKLLFD